MEDKIAEAGRALDAKVDEIRELVAAKLGLGPLNQMNEDDRETFCEEVAALIDDHEQAMADGDTMTEWQIRERTIARSDLGRLLLERHEIEQKLLDSLGDEADDD